MGRLVAVAVALPFVAGLAAAGAAPPGTVELTFTDPDIVESSGLVARGDLVVTVNDSGDTGRVFTVDRASGDTVGVTTWSDDPEDVEAVTWAGDAHPRDVWVGDIGDNGARRRSVTVVRVPFGRGDRDVRDAVTPYELVYPQGPRDAETLLVEPRTGRLVVVTKEVFGGDVLIAPRRLDPDRPNVLRSIGTSVSIATDGAFWPDGRHLVVRGYASAAVYTWPGLDVVGRLDLPDQQQGEGIAVDEDGVVLISTEGFESDVLRVRLPRAVAKAVAPVPVAPVVPSSGPTSGAGPGDLGPAVASSPSRWPFVVGGAFGVVLLALLVRALRPRG